MIHRLIVPLTLAMLLVRAEQAPAQGAFPAPLPGQANQTSPFPPVNGAPAASTGAAPASPFPSAGTAPIAGAGGGGRGFGPPPGSSGGPSEACTKNFMPLREEAEKRGKMIKAASERHAPPDEACKLIAAFSQSEMKMIKYVETNSAKCGIPPQIAEQLKGGHKNTEAMQTRVCNVAEQVKTRGPAGPSLSEVLGSANAAPEVTTTAKKGGSTFDTLNGNVLQR